MSRKKNKTKKQKGETRRQKLLTEKNERKNKTGKKSKYAQKIQRRKNLTGGLPLPLAA